VVCFESPAIRTPPVISSSLCCADAWVKGYRNMKRALQDTTGICEGWHSALKAGGLAEKRRLQGRRPDWLVYKLFVEVLSQLL
jgi:hypothetical protein